ncbi:beta-ketoacyl synthase chain length factor [Bacteroides sp. 224]|uniref:beta-ketoacyl synthase chain length factor n=1 Tax=Bacteroides sp. 224 TaxID=2302936 RepID=UPI0013D62B6D|nr:3-oxoacyl-ACP synthase [Bacteroides sp. 224]
MAPAYINSIASIRAEEPDYKELIPNPTLRRRMSRIVKMGVACGLQCIGNTPTEEIEAIITATGLGCLADTEKFMNNLLDNQEQLLNPTPFIQSTFNTVGAQIALITQNQSYNVTYAHRGFSFESALLDGLLRIHEGNRQVLIGAFDEITETLHIILQRMGLLKDKYAEEGAQFFLLSKEQNEQTYARIYAPCTFVTSPKENNQSIIYRRIEEYLQQNHLTFAEVVVLSNYQAPCGQYPTASSYAVWQAANLLKENEEDKPLLIYTDYNHINHSLILVSKP